MSVISKAFSFAAQLVLVLAAVPAANFAHEAQLIVPRAFAKSSPLSVDMLINIAAVMVSAHLVVLGLMRLFNGVPPFYNFRRFLSEGFAAMTATSLGAASIFTFTTIPFPVNFFAWLYALIFLGYFALYFLFRSRSWAGVAAPMPEKSFLSLFFSPWIYVSAALIALPGVLAVAYKMSQPFSNAVNNFRAQLSMGSEVTYGLADAFASQRFTQPMAFEFEPGGTHILVWSRTGVLFRHAVSGQSEPEIVLDLSAEVGSTDNEMGAYNLALHPNYGRAGASQEGHVYLYYSTVQGRVQRNRLVRYDISNPAPEAIDASRVVLWDLGRRPTGMHNGGGMFFGTDGFLYVSLGDFNEQRELQRIDERLISGIFRLDPDMRGGDISAPIRHTPKDGVTGNYYVPKDNPWYGTEDALEEYWALGFRNPWRMSMDTETGDIWLGDVGWDSFEEQNRVPAGGNGQWPFREGPQETKFPRPDQVVGQEVAPAYWYAQTALERAAMGGLVYRGSRFPELTGQYIFADNMAATVYALDPQDPMNTVRVIAQGQQYGQLGMTSISTDPAGEIYFTFLGQKGAPTGEIVRLTDETDENAPAVEDLSEEDRLAALVTQVDKTYVSVCARCHGADGRGEQNLDLGVLRPDFTSAAWQRRVTDEHLHKVIAKGGEAVGLSETMPGWDEVLSPEEIDLMVQKVRGFGG